MFEKRGSIRAVLGILGETLLHKILKLFAPDILLEVRDAFGSDEKEGAQWGKLHIRWFTLSHLLGMMLVNNEAELKTHKTQNHKTHAPPLS
jgi:hypothetical protein